MSMLLLTKIFFGHFKNLILKHINLQKPCLGSTFDFRGVCVHVSLQTEAMKITLCKMQK